MNCHRCGALLPENTSICPYCGEAAASAPPQPNSGAPYPPPDAAYPPPPYPPVDGSAPYQPYGYAPYGGYPPPPSPPADLPSFGLHLAFSIVVTIVCCQYLLGIPAIVFAALISSRIKEGNYDGARQAAKLSRLFMFIGIGLSLLVVILYFVLLSAGLNYLDFYSDFPEYFPGFLKLF